MKAEALYTGQRPPVIGCAAAGRSGLRGGGRTSSSSLRAEFFTDRRRGNDHGGVIGLSLSSAVASFNGFSPIAFRPIRRYSGRERIRLFSEKTFSTPCLKCYVVRGQIWRHNSIFYEVVNATELYSR
ncbi:hypothetical protein J6590_046011 [Homalodisca vitripennis]|nr:hypothetical protein J6590_046011 [Homalodisca vitripennis]